MSPFGSTTEKAEQRRELQQQRSAFQRTPTVVHIPEFYAEPKYLSYEEYRSRGHGPGVGNFDKKQERLVQMGFTLLGEYGYGQIAWSVPEGWTWSSQIVGKFDEHGKLFEVIALRDASEVFRIEVTFVTYPWDSAPCCGTGNIEFIE